MEDNHHLSSPKPGTSKMKEDTEMDVVNTEANKSEEAQPNDQTKKENTEETKKIRFYCENCSMEEWCDYFGKKPPFVNRIKFLEDCYTMRDPFSPPPPKSLGSKAEYFIVLGAHCIECNKVVCKSTKCSFFYANTYCLNCAQKEIKEFPLEIQTKIKKQIANNS